MAKKHHALETTLQISPARIAEMRAGMLRIKAAIEQAAKSGVSSRAHLDSIGRDMALWASWLAE